MHDTILFSKISESLKECCTKENISKISEVIVAVNDRSHVNSNNLSEYLRNYNENLVDDNIKVTVKIEDLPDQTAIIRRIEGEEKKIKN